MSPTLALLMFATLLATLPWQQVTGQEETGTTTTISAVMEEEGTKPTTGLSDLPDGAAASTTTVQMTTTKAHSHKGGKSKDSGAYESAHLSAFIVVSSTLITLMASHL